MKCEAINLTQEGIYPQATSLRLLFEPSMLTSKDLKRCFISDWQHPTPLQAPGATSRAPELQLVLHDGMLTSLRELKTVPLKSKPTSHPTSVSLLATLDMHTGGSAGGDGDVGACGV